MPLRHAGVLSALLLTCALLCAMPGLVRLPQEASRADDSLRPAQLRTVTVWLMPGDVGDRKLINAACAAFEKANDGARVFLRVVTAEEFTAENAVLPDVALFETGDIAVPEALFVPLDSADASGRFAGVDYAAALWFAPNVLSLPQAWFASSPAATARPESLLAAATAAPEEETLAMLAPKDLPWAQLLRPGALDAPTGVGWQQLLSLCPADMQAQLVQAVTGQAAAASTPAPKLDGVPKGGGASPTPAPAITTPARVETLAQHRQRLQKGENLLACPLSPAVSDRVRYAAICRDSADARAFVQLLQASDPLAYGLIPMAGQPSGGDALTHAVWEAYASPVHPNAFAHTRQEIAQLCADAFLRREDPVQTLLKLR